MIAEPEFKWSVDVPTIDRLLHQHESSQQPGVVIGIGLNGRPVYRRGFGLANIELPVNLTSHTKMRIASITKHFTCLAYLMLCESERASLDDPISKFFPNFDAIVDGVTIRDLMSHTSGLRDANDLYWQLSGPDRWTSSLEIISLYDNLKSVNFPPRYSWCYNNGGYLLLTAAIEKLTGGSLGAFLKERVFDPIGMYDTELRKTDRDFVSESASLHAIARDGSFTKASIGELTGEGGIVSTADDMLRWMAHMERPIVGSAASWKSLVTPTILSSGVDTGQALGLAIDHYRGFKTIAHSGGVVGGGSHMIKLPAAGLDVIVLSNRQDFDSVSMALDIVDACISEFNCPTVSRHTAVVGSFVSTSGDRLIELNEASIKTNVTIDGISADFVSIAPNKLVANRTERVFKRQIEICSSEAGQTFLKLTEFGVPEIFEPICDDAATDGSSFSGIYVSPEMGATLMIDATSESPFAVSQLATGEVRFTLQRISGAVWKARPDTTMHWGGVIFFAADHQSLRFTTHRTRGLLFQRSDGEKPEIDSPRAVDAF